MFNPGLISFYYRGSILLCTHTPTPTPIHASWSFQVLLVRTDTLLSPGCWSVTSNLLRWFSGLRQLLFIYVLISPQLNTQVGTFCKPLKLPLSLQFSPENSSWELRMWSSQALSFVFATHRVYLVLPGCPLSVLWPGNSLQAISWDNCSASFICFNLSGIIILLCLLSCAFQTTVSGILSIWGLVSGGRGNQSLILANSLHLKFKACFYPKKFFFKYILWN